MTKIKYSIYIFFDEIQNVVNSLRATKNTYIFITGSNSDLLSSDLATHIAGRYVSFKITPFTFDEVCKLLNITDNRNIEDTFNDYIKWGRMPQRFNEKIYIQVTYILSDETVIDREFNAYKKIEDNYPKYVLSMDKFDLSQNGIIHKNIIDWLLKK